MNGLPSELYLRCRNVLSKCAEFDGNASLIAVFVTAELAPFKGGLQEAPNKTGRIDMCLNYLLPKQLVDGRHVFPIFLETLRDRYLEGDMLRNELGSLAGDVSAVLSPSGATISPASPAPAKPANSGRAGTIAWLHISDLHFRESSTYDENIVLKALINDIGERIQNDGLRPDFIAVTGDIAFSGKSSEYELAKAFFDKLNTKTGIDRERLFIVPGNHDADRSLITLGAKAIGGSLQDRNSVNTLLNTPGDRGLVMDRFKGYAQFFNDYFGNSQTFDDGNYFHVKTFDIAGQTIAVLGLNSSWLAESNEDKANGLVIGERQTRAALDMAKDAGADLTIALMHHPFDWLREFDYNDSAAMLQDNCDFILHGHLHRSSLARLSGPDSDAMTIAAGACYETREFPNSYNIVKLDLTNRKGLVYLRRYSDERGGFWAKDTLTYRNVTDGEYSFSFGGTPQSSAVSNTSPIGSTTGTGNRSAVPPQTQTNVSQAPDIASLRRRIKQQFDDIEFDSFCQDHFPEVYAKFGAGQRRDQKINILMDICRRKPEEYRKALAELDNQ